MNKETITAPRGIAYLSELKIKDASGREIDFELPNGILSKGLTGCGGTHLALTDSHPTVICSPRRALL